MRRAAELQQKIALVGVLFSRGFCPTVREDYGVSLPPSLKRIKRCICVVGCFPPPPPPRCVSHARPPFLFPGLLARVARVLIATVSGGGCSRLWEELGRRQGPEGRRCYPWRKAKEDRILGYKVKTNLTTQTKQSSERRNGCSNTAAGTVFVGTCRGKLSLDETSTLCWREAPRLFSRESMFMCCDVCVAVCVLLYYTQCAADSGIGIDWSADGDCVDVSTNGTAVLWLIGVLIWCVGLVRSLVLER